MLTKISLKKLTDTPEVDGKIPSHAIIACDDKYENKTQVGKLWLKSGQYGNFLSGQLDKERTTDAGVTYQGYVLITEKEYNELKSNATGEVIPSGLNNINF